MASTSVVYFAQAQNDGPIKIGVTSGAPLDRIAGLQTGCPWPIRLLGAVEGTTQHEAWLHARFAALNVSGEWFAPDDELINAIQNMLSDAWVWPEILPARRARRGNKLGMWLDERGLTESAFGLQIDRSQAAVWRYVTGARIPDREAMAAIYLATNGEIAPNDFYELPALVFSLTAEGN